MSENGTENRTNVWKEVAGQISDHVDLASLELRYETQQAGKKLVSAAIVLVLVLTGFIVLQVAIIGVLTRIGLSLGMSAFLLSLVYFAAAAGVAVTLGQRDKRVGPPFVGTQREIHETLKWIQKILS